jgi:hypothetical protein
MAHPNDRWDLAPILAFVAAVVAVFGALYLVTSMGEPPVTTAKAPQTNSGPSDTSSRPSPPQTPSQ